MTRTLNRDLPVMRRMALMICTQVVSTRGNET